MKKNFTLLLAFSLASITYSQSEANPSVDFNNNSSDASNIAVSEGSILISAYYGGPNLNATILEAAYSNIGENSPAASIGPVGGTFSYMVTDGVGVGLDVNYTDISITWNDNTVDSSGTSVNYDYKVGMSTIRIMPRFDFHFGTTEKFAPYVGVAAGWRSRTYYTETDDPNFEDSNAEGFNPIAFRIAAGGSIFLSNNIGINLELGLGGGGLVRGGLVFKL